MGCECERQAQEYAVVQWKKLMAYNDVQQYTLSFCLT